MSKPNVFVQELINLVRSLPDDALLDLVRHRLDVAQMIPQSASKQYSPARKARLKRRTRATSADREQLVSLIERLVTGSRGLSSTQIAKMVKAATPRVQSVLRELKHDKRIFQGGDRRFARYAGDAETAQAASRNAKHGQP